MNSPERITLFQAAAQVKAVRMAERQTNKLKAEDERKRMLHEYEKLFRETYGSLLPMLDFSCIAWSIEVESFDDEDGWKLALHLVPPIDEVPLAVWPLDRRYDQYNRDNPYSLRISTSGSWRAYNFRELEPDELLVCMSEAMTLVPEEARQQQQADEEKREQQRQQHQRQAMANSSAFARPMGNNGATSYEDRVTSDEESGMSLRAYIAARALQGLLSAVDAKDMPENDAARIACLYADRLIDHLAATQQ